MNMYVWCGTYAYVLHTPVEVDDYWVELGIYITFDVYQWREEYAPSTQIRVYAIHRHYNLGQLYSAQNREGEVYIVCMQVVGASRQNSSPTRLVKTKTPPVDGDTTRYTH